MLTAMAALTVVVDPAEPPDRRAATAEAMLAAAPHRGELAATAHGLTCTIAVGAGPDWAEADAVGVDGLAVGVAGFLDNRAELASELGLPGEPSSAAVVAAAYRAWGTGFAARLRGAFSAAVSDGRRVVALRDHLGFAPLFYRVDGERAWLATEAKQVVAGAGISYEPDVEALSAILFDQYDDDTPAALRGVRRLPKATVLDLTAGRPTLDRYWWPEDLVEGGGVDTANVPEQFDALMAQAVRRTLTGSDAVSLSGGVDSPAVAAYGACGYQERFGRRLGAISAVYPDLPSVDESAYIALVAERLDLDLHTYRPQPQSLADLQRWMRLFDGPCPTIWVSELDENYRRARAAGYTTVLTGEMAEYLIELRRHLIPHLVAHRRWRPLGALLRDQRRRNVSVRRQLREVGQGVLPRWALQAYADRRQPADVLPVPPWVDRGRLRLRPPMFALPAAERWRALQSAFLAGPGLTIEADDVCQAVDGVRVRRPWADVDLWEFFLRLPAEVKFPTHRYKGLVRRLLRGRVPDEILDRRNHTVFNDSVMDRVDYAGLRQWLTEPRHRLPGIDYPLLRERVEQQRMELPEYVWAKDLAGVTAFLDLW